MSVWSWLVDVATEAITMIPGLAGGLVKSISIFCWTLLFALPLGLLIAFGRMSKRKVFGRFHVIRSFTKLYIDIMRGTPLMLQLMVVFYGPYYLWGANIAGFRYPAIIIAFSLNYAAYFGEIYRSGIESMPLGQYEAAQVLGYTRGQTFFKIILPQVIKRILPAVTNEVITLVKDTSLAFSLAYMEMFTLAKQIAAKNTTFLPFVVSGIFYFVFNAVVARIMNGLEKKMDYYR
ncbi:MAG: amino acid ABC transporter permease [bacterium]|nr:amino acid ABC transporter permease [bacterium]